MDGLIETEETVILSSLDEYQGAQYPCADVSVECGDATCSMTYTTDTDPIESLLSSNTSDTCLWVNLQEIQSISCNGGNLDELSTSANRLLCRASDNTGNAP